jgi:hypothetical protein
MGFSYLVILTILLSACGGGGGGGGGSNAPATVAISVTPAMGMFQDNSTVTISDNQGKLCGTGKTSGGVAKITITPSSCAVPLIVQAGIAGDKYFNEATNLPETITGTQGIRAVVPSTSYTSLGVTPLTDIAAASLINTTTGGLNSGVTAKSVTDQNVYIAKLLSKDTVTDPLAVPAAASSTTSPATNSYGAVLAMLSALVPGQTPQAIANNLAKDLADGTWDGVASGSTIQNAIVPANFGTKMAAAATAVSASVNATTAATIVIDGTYFPSANIASGVAAVSSGGSSTPAVAGDPIATAKTLFTSLRTNADLLNTPNTSGSFAFDMQANSNALSNVVLPDVNATASKFQTIAQANSFLNDINTNVLTNLPNVPNTVNPVTQQLTVRGCLKTFRNCSELIPGTPGKRYFQWVYYSSNNIPITCSISLPTSSFAPLTAGNTVYCQGRLEAPVYTYDNTSFTSTTNTPTFVNSITYNSANNYSYVSRTINSISTYNLSTLVNTPSSTFTSNYSGTATAVAGTAAQPSSVTISGDLAGDGITYDHTTIGSMGYTRTWTAPSTGTLALANYAFTGSAANYATASATSPASVITLGAGTVLNIPEDSTGSSPATATSANVTGASATLNLTALWQSGTSTRTFNGTLAGSNFQCDISGTSCSPRNMSFTGSIANDTLKTVANVSITYSADYSAYDSTLATSGKNMPAMSGTISGTLINNAVSPAMTYQFTLNAANSTNASGDELLALGLIYIDPSATVNVSTVLNGGPNGSTQNPTTINLSSGSVVGVLSSTNGVLTGKLYNGSTAGSVIGTVSNVNGVIQIAYSDGTFYSFQ